MRVLLLLLLLALSSAQDYRRLQSLTGSDAAALSNEAELATDKDSNSDSNLNLNSTLLEEKAAEAKEEQLAQAPQLLRSSSGLDAFYALFPALSNLLRFGNLISAQSILGSSSDALPAASKVVLVLADDANARTQRSRRVRQDAQTAAAPVALTGPALMAKMFNAPAPASIGELVGASLPPISTGWFNPIKLGELLPPNVGQALQTSTGVDLLQWPQQLLGAPLPTVDAAPTETTAPPAKTDDATVGAPPPATLPALPNFAAFFNQPAFDGNTNLLGAPLAPQPAAADDFVAGWNKFWAASAAPAAAASQISEVRVRPDGQTINYRDHQATDAQLAELKLKSEQEQQRVPLLWFRLPTNGEGTEQPTAGSAAPKDLEDLRIEAKLQVFERQVIAELKLLQQIERLAKEMRANAQGQAGSSPGYPLSRTPVHKITRADIERALRDDYVRRLLHKEAQRQFRSAAHFKYLQQADSVAVKRQTMPAEPSLSKEDIVKMMAYAYRMANEQTEAEKKSKEDKIYAAYRAGADEAAKAQQQHIQQNPMMQRQWADEAAKTQPQQQQHIQQNPMMQRQWADEAAKEKQQQAQQNPMTQRQWADETAKAQQQQQQQQRQWADETAKAQQQQQQHSAMIMMQQRQWADEPAKTQQQQQQQQRQWADETAKAQQQHSEKIMMQQRQWADEVKAKAQQQQQERQWAEAKVQQQQQDQAAKVQQQQQQERQWAEAKSQQEKQQQIDRQWAEAKAQEQPRQWADDAATKPQQDQPIQQNPIMIQQQQRQWADEAAKTQPQQQQHIQQNPMMQRQWADEAAKTQPQQQQHIQQNPMMQRQWADEAAKTQPQQQQHIQQQSPMMMQQRQWADEAKPQQQSQQNPMQHRQWAEQQPGTALNADQQWEVEKQKALQQQQQQQPQLRQQEDAMLGEAQPQMPENAGKARHKGADLLGLGGDKHKKHHGGGGIAPTIINYYQSVPAYRPSYGGYSQQPSYGGGYSHQQSYGGGGYSHRPSYGGGSSSYGTSYGGGGYASNAYGGGGGGGYRAAVGNDEIDDMLRQHQTVSTINPAAAEEIFPATHNATPTRTRTTITTDRRLEKRWANFFRDEALPFIRFGNAASNGCGCSSGHCSCSRASGCNCGSDCRCAERRRQRQRRSAQYGTLETIDERSLSALRKEYKTALKEITLSPDEDPTEALMRYNAASIREALERSQQDTLEINGDQLAGEAQTNPNTDYTPVTTNQLPNEEGGSYAPAESLKQRLPQKVAADQYSTKTELETTTERVEETTNATEASTEATTEAPEPIPEETVPVAEYKKLNTVIDELKQQLAKLGEKCKDCQDSKPLADQEEESPPATAAPARSNSIVSVSAGDEADERSWRSVLASKGYDIKYLSKTNEQQYAQGESLDLGKGSSSSADYTYQEFQPYVEAEKSTAQKRAAKIKQLKAAKASDESCEVSTERRRRHYKTKGEAMSIKEQVQRLNAELAEHCVVDEDEESDGTTTPTPYALRGKFQHRRKSERATRQAVSTPRPSRQTRKVKINTGAGKGASTEATSIRECSSKLDQLMELLHDLLRVQLRRSAVATTTTQSPISNSVKRSKTKRLRRKNRKSNSSGDQEA